MEDYKIESHKLIYHVSRVNDWLRRGDTTPIFIEVSPSGTCNHRCVFCSFDYLGYSGPKIDKEYLLAFLLEAAALGTKSVLYAGEGEPLLHEDIVEIITETESFGIDVALSTNGVLFNDLIASQVLGSLTWMRFSVDAATKETHSDIHRCSEHDFEKIVNNITNAVSIKARNNFKCTIGVQFLLLPQNEHEVFSFANMFRDIGVDYVTIKPFFRRPMSHQSPDSDFHYNDFALIKYDLLALASDRFKVIFRSHAMEKLEQPKMEYDQCLGLPFSTYVAAKGGVYTCDAFVGMDDFCYGNIYTSSFSDIWWSEKRETVLRRVAEMDISQCHVNCRMDEINRYLWELKHPKAISHLNFI
jgi:cyclic pyranopterin phosphate synthase